MSEKRYLKLNDLDAFKWSFSFSNKVWKLVLGWDNFSRRTIGSQFVNAADSISANIAEGFGRYHKKDKIKFYRYSQGSLKECFDWTAKSKVRDLIDKEKYERLITELQQLEPAIYRLIKYTNEN